LLENTDDVDPIDMGAVLLAQGRRLVNEGQPDEALAVFHKVQDLLGDARFRRERAGPLGDIARILGNKGQVDEALKLHQEQLGIYEQLGATRERAVTLDDIARILRAKGQVDEALKLHQEQLGIYEQLGATRERANTLGDIAQILGDKGQVGEALKLHQERLGIYEQLEDAAGRANALWSIANIEIQHQSFQAAFDHLVESYQIFVQLERLDGICVVGLDLGCLLADAGQTEQAVPILTRSCEGFKQRGQLQMAQQVQQLIDQIQSPPSSEDTES
jgi:tetratricopeptide (TPR) repeat protein